MGIVRLAKALKQLNALTEISSRKNDLANRLDGNRVYMDFISIVYRVQESVIMELNNLLYSLILLKHNLIGKHDIDSGLVEKYDMREFIETFENVGDSIDRIDTFIQKTNQQISNYVYNDVVDYVVDIICQKIRNTEYLLIAFDGIPSFAKIQEQRQRRYMRYCAIEFQRHIYQNNNNNKLKNQYPLRDIFDSLKFIPNIRQSIDYVYDRYEKLHLKMDILSRSKKICIDSNPTIEVLNERYGEGEKILMDRMIVDHMKYPDRSYVFFSPDGDSVLLSLQIYLVRKIERLVVIKQYLLNPTNEHNNKSQYVDIPNLYRLIVQKVSSFAGIDMNAHENKRDLSDGIARDYLMLMTLYGNDFLHQIPTMEISSTHIDLIFCYAKYLEQHRKCLITMHNRTATIDVTQFKEFIKILAGYEEMIMLDSYLAECESRTRIVKYFGDLFTHQYLLDYREKVGVLKQQLLIASPKNTQILEKILSDGLNMLSQYSNPYGNTYDMIFLQCEVKNRTKYIENIIAGKNKDPRFLYRINQRRNKNGMIMWQLISGIEAPFIKDNRKIDIAAIMSGEIKHKMSADEFDKFMFDYRNIRALVPNAMMPTTTNDLDLYLLDWKSGKWQAILNAYPYDFGFDSRTQRQVALKYEMKRYQNQFLELGGKQIARMCEFYLQGIGWVVDYYMNSRDTRKYISTWSYNYHRSPFISHIMDACLQMDTDKMNRLMRGIYRKTSVATSTYLDKQGQSIYIYPLNGVDRKLFMDNSELSKYIDSFPDMDEYVRASIDQYRTKSHHKYFDCRLCPYFSKCIFESRNLTYRDLKIIIDTIYPKTSVRKDADTQTGGSDNMNRQRFFKRRNISYHPLKR